MTSRYRYDLDALTVPHTGPTRDLRAYLGISGQQWLRYMAHGVSERSADRFAVKCGKHPFEVWPEMIDDAITETSGAPAVAVLHAFVRCVTCGRMLTADTDPVVTPEHGELVMVCTVGHRNRIALTVEEAR